ncbi:PTS lactose/cellobiose transporter subunit IIA [Spiroplasma taiwanense]|uniref:PTS system cellobiose-specific IIA component n=1 Tax=Spiroplasma taiwanense CT-1 TaxID=1276220 RepID=S5MAV4_9MOLU|nr:PTS lactose/cellobiose transporter subunit IIA [Spiroplasma taiwanense]AGR40898.1 PTS system cellobiose-specific IIA component [Spiroplasma taiwanense CT-1]
MEKINLEEVSMFIISSAGIAKSNAILAIKAAKKLEFEKAEELLKIAEQEMINAHHAHFEVVSREATGKQLDFKLLFVHAEDQFLTTQAMIDLSKEMIEMYKIVHKK